MSSGGTATSKSIFLILLISLAAVATIALSVNFEMLYNIIVYGKISGPCVWPGDYVGVGGNMSDLAYNENSGCYQEPTS